MVGINARGRMFVMSRVSFWVYIYMSTMLKSGSLQHTANSKDKREEEKEKTVYDTHNVCRTHTCLPTIFHFYLSWQQGMTSLSIPSPTIICCRLS
jgi:hypothetical protein